MARDNAFNSGSCSRIYNKSLICSKSSLLSLSHQPGSHISYCFAEVKQVPAQQWLLWSTVPVKRLQDKACQHLRWNMMARLTEDFILPEADDSNMSLNCGCTIPSHWTASSPGARILSIFPLKLGSVRNVSAKGSPADASYETVLYSFVRKSENTLLTWQIDPNRHISCSIQDRRRKTYHDANWAIPGTCDVLPELISKDASIMRI